MAFALLFFVGYALIAGFLPPLSPDNTAEETARVYIEDTDSIRAGLLVCFIGCMCFLAFGAGIAGQTRRIPGVAPTIIILQIAAFAAAVLLIILPIICWWVAAFRPDTRSAEGTEILNDLGFLMFVVGFAPFVTWFAATGLAILSDTSASPVFPRWSGYLGIFMAMVQVPPGMLVFFKTGPFAWDGMFSWWIPLTDFFLWFVIMTVLTLKAINSQYDHESDVGSRVSQAVPQPTGT